MIAIGAALGLGRAIEQSGAGKVLADAMLAAAGGDPWLTLAAFYLAGALLTAVLTNNAAVALLFPAGIASAAQLGVSAMPFVITLMMAGSASFATPIGYQTNLMVYGPGGYRFADYLRIGVLMNIVIGLATLILVPMVWPF